MRSNAARIALLVFLLTCAAFLRFLRSERAGQWICEAVRERAGALMSPGEFSIGHCAFAPWEAEIQVEELSAVVPGEPALRLKAGRAQIQLLRPELLPWRLRFGKVNVSDLEVEIALDPDNLPKGDPQADKSCPIAPLDRLRVEQLTFSNARFALQLPADRRVELVGIDASAHSGKASHSLKLSISSGELSNGPASLPIARIKLSAALDLEADELNLTHLELSAGDLSLFARGGLESLCGKARADLLLQLFLPLGLFDAMLPELDLGLRGHATLRARLDGPLDNPAIEGDLSLIKAEIADFEIGDAYLAARVEEKTALIDRLELNIGAQKAIVNGAIGLGQDFPTKARVELDQIGFGQLLDMLSLDHVWPDFKASGTVEATGTLVPFHLAGKARLDLRDFKVFDRGWDQAGREAMLELAPAHLDIDVDFTPQRAHLANVDLSLPRSRLKVDTKLFFDEQRGLDITTSFDPIDLSDLGHIVQIPWSGLLSGHARLKGPYAEIAIDGEVEGQRLRFHELDFGRANLEVHFEDLVLAFRRVHILRGQSRFDAAGELDFSGHAPEGRGQGHFEGALLSDLVDMIGRTHWIFDFIRDRAQARLSGTASVRGELLKPESRIEASLDDLVYYGRRLGHGELVFSTRDGEIVAIDRFDIDGPVGKASLWGEIRLSEGLDFRLKAPALSIFELSKPQGEFLDAGGSLSLNARLFGGFDDVRIRGEADVKDATALGVPLGSGPLDLGMDDFVLWLRGPIGEALRIEGRMTAEGALPFAIDVSVATRQLGRYLPQSLGVDGTLKATLTASGTIDAIEQTRGRLDVESLQLTRERLRLRSDKPFQATFVGGAIELPFIALRGSNDLRASGAFRRTADGSLDGSLTAHFDARLAEAFVDDISQTGGPIRAELNLLGTLERPTILGTLTLRGVRASHADMPVRAQDLRGSVSFSQNKLYLDGIEGTLNDGRARLGGEIDFEGLFDPKRLDLSIAFDDAQFRLPSWLPSTLSGDLRLSGTPSALNLSGAMSISHVRYQRDVGLDLKSLITRLGQRAPDFILVEEEKSWLNLNLGVRLGEEVWIDNNMIRTRLGGELQIVGDNLDLGVIGTVRVEDEGKLFFRGNEFELTRATVDFTDRDRIAAILDVHAETELRDYRVFLRLMGSLDEPELTLSSEPDLDQADLVMLLTLGFTTRETEMASSSVGIGLIGETLLNLSGLDKQVKRFMPNNAVFRDFNIQLATQYSEVSGTVEPMAQIESKLLTDDLRLRLVQPVLSSRGRQAHLEYRMNEHLSAQMQWNDEMSDFSLGDFGLDLKLRWELE